VQEARAFTPSFTRWVLPSSSWTWAAGWAWITTAAARRSTAPPNYTLQEYTNDIVYYIADVCNAEKVPHPNIISESGRAIVAHHSVLIVEVFGYHRENPAGKGVAIRRKNEHPLVRELLDIRKNLPSSTSWRPTTTRRRTQGGRAAHVHPGHDGFAGQGQDRDALLGNQPRGGAKVSKGQAYIPEEIRKLEDSLGDQYLCNFSVFQSLLDHWALGQLFPIMPSTA
jgi:arginine decarboxylase